MDELEVLRIRDEVLQAMYWMHSEGLADAPPAKELARFLAVPAATLSAYLERFVADGYLEPVNGGYSLTAHGKETGKRTFAEEFADLTRPTHGECDEDCWCHESPEDAARCLEECAGHVHVH
jgi:DNA-binding MarR family transcriptional regulator